MEKGLVYYTDNHCSDMILRVVQKRLLNLCRGFDIVSISHKAIEFGRNIVVDLPRSWESIFRQILIGVEACDAEVIYLAEHDVLYHPTHFEFIPPGDRFYYNQHRWCVDAQTGNAIYGPSWCMSQLVALKSSMLNVFTERVKMIEKDGYRNSMSSAPIAHRSRHFKSEIKLGRFMSEYPNIDIRHDMNFTPNEFSRKTVIIEAHWIPGWGRTFGRFNEFLNEVRDGKTDTSHQ